MHVKNTKAWKAAEYEYSELKDELIDKMERYNLIRHDDDMDEEEKEAIREELFEGDHAWPFL